MSFEQNIGGIGLKTRKEGRKRTEPSAKTSHRNRKVRRAEMDTKRRWYRARDLAGKKENKGLIIRGRGYPGEARLVHIGFAI